jgi:3D (Asp-Asp-Asp) domain-containing protein
MPREGLFDWGKVPQNHMYKKLTVLVAAAAVLTISVIHAATTKADIVKVQSSNPIADAVAGLPQEAYSIIPMRITAYSSSPDETDNTPFITANGTIVHDGIVASNMLPFGTKIKIPSLFGDKVFTIEDRMSPKYYRTIDIWMPSKDAAVVFGLAYAKIVVLGTSTYAQNPVGAKIISANLR